VGRGVLRRRLKV